MEKDITEFEGGIVSETPGSREQSAHKIGGDIHAFSAGLNWLAQRSVFYTLIAESLEGVAVCHPIRNDFLARFFVERLNSNGPDQRKAIMTEFQKTSLETVNLSNALLGGGAFKVVNPVISAWATSKAGSPKAARDLVNELRYSSEAIALRKRLRDLENLIKSDDVEGARRDAVKLMADYRVMSEGFFRKYADKGQDPYKISVNLFSLSGSFNFSNVKEKVESLLPKRRKSIALLRNITLDLLQNPSLGHVSDLLRSDRKVEGEVWDPVYSPKIDKPRFRYSRPYWKKPMD